MALEAHGNAVILLTATSRGDELERGVDEQGLFLDEPSPAKLRVREDRLERCSRGSSSNFESNNIVSDLDHMYCGEERRRASLLRTTHEFDRGE